MSHAARRPRRLVILLAAAAAGTLALAACGSDGGDESTPSSPAASWVTESPPASGPVDSVVWNLPYGEPFTLDYIQALSPSDSTVLANLCESLLRMTPEMTYEPGLAESWDSPDPTTWVYDLRPGLTFGNGNPVTPEDVVFSLERHTVERLGSFWAPWFENVESIRVTGPDQVTVTLTQPDVLFNQFMATAAGVVAEKAYVEEQGGAYGSSKGGVSCVGPYELREWTPGKSIELEANPDYWDAENRPQTAVIDFRFVTNNQTVADALSTGEIDGTFEAPLRSWPRLVGSDGGSALLGRSTGYTSLDFSEKEGPVQNADFRRALLLSLDKEAIAQSIYEGTADPVRSVFFPTTWGYAEDVYREGYEALPPPGQNLEAAKEAFAKVPDPRPVTLLSNADDDAAKLLAAYIQSEAGKVGIEIELRELPAPQYISAAFDREQFNTYDIGLSTGGYVDIAEPVQAGVLSLVKDGVFNSLGYDNPSVNQWVAEARRTTDPQERAALMVKVQKQAYETDVVAIPLVNWAARVYLNSGLTGTTTALTPIFYSPWAAGLGAAG